VISGSGRVPVSKWGPFTTLLLATLLLILGNRVRRVTLGTATVSTEVLNKCCRFTSSKLPLLRLWQLPPVRLSTMQITCTHLLPGEMKRHSWHQRLVLGISSPISVIVHSCIRARPTAGRKIVVRWGDVSLVYDWPGESRSVNNCACEFRQLLLLWLHRKITYLLVSPKARSLTVIVLNYVHCTNR